MEQMYKLLGAEFFANVKEEYKDGELVTIYYGFVATDTRYNFYVDGCAITTDYSHEKGFELSFIMPAHDVTIKVETENTML
ncbi:MAG: hypothetical protein K6G26_05290 [Lachnospiraceae bacterium]|nr:hypothetical protein [Lachnospiraceae bacterium]